jgi:uncharacterized protein YlxW (UPF0749 family)
MFSRISVTFFCMIAMISLLSIASVQAADNIQARKQAPEIHDYTVRLSSSSNEKRQRVKRHFSTE